MAAAGGGPAKASLYVPPSQAHAEPALHGSDEKMGRVAAIKRGVFGVLFVMAKDTSVSRAWSVGLTALGFFQVT